MRKLLCAVAAISFLAGSGCGRENHSSISGAAENDLGDAAGETKQTDDSDSVKGHEDWSMVDWGFKRVWTIDHFRGYCASSAPFVVYENKRTGRQKTEFDPHRIFCADSHYGSKSDAEIVFYKPKEKVVDGKRYLISDLKEVDVADYDPAGCGYVPLSDQGAVNVMRAHSVTSWWESTDGKTFWEFQYDQDAKTIDGCYKMLKIRS